MTIEELKTLKAAVKAEMLRRNGYGSVANYGGVAYDFTNQPAVDKPIYPEYGQKTINLLLKIEDYGDLINVEENGPIPRDFNGNLVNEVNRLAGEVKNGESAKTVGNLYPSRTVEKSSCRGACTGLCVGTCTGFCNGCDNGCTASCGTSCQSGCTSCTNCTGNCSGSCSNGCSTTCYTGCKNGCMSSCSGGSTKQVGS